jgi:alpha-tubulin suppressor-like RCC1 family protein
MDPSKTWSLISIADGNGCGLEASTGAAYCWGMNLHGGLGTGNTSNIHTPAQVVNSTVSSWSYMEINRVHTCGLETGTGKAYCFGKNDVGQLGDGSTTDSSVPTAVSTSTVASWHSLSVGFGHNCGLQAGTLKGFCFGSGFSGALGTGNGNNAYVPVAVDTSAVAAWASISCGFQFTCGTANGSNAAYCFGKNDAGQLGIGSTSDQSVPTAVVSTTVSAWAELKVARAHTCGLELSTQKAYCFGENGDGRLGSGNVISTAAPVAVVSSTVSAWSQLRVGRGVYGSNTCGIEYSTGRGYCFGYNGDGQLGTGATGNPETAPTAIDTSLVASWKQIALEGYYAW